MKIVNFGSANIDYVYSLDHIVENGETETSYNLEIFSGGKGLNQSIAISRAGALVYHAGCIGSDGEMLLDILSQSNVDVSYVKNVDSKNGHAIIQVNSKGDNSIFIYPGSNDMVTKEYVDEILTNFSKGDIVVLQNEISNVKYIVEKAYEKGLKIVFNPSPFNDKIREIDLNMIAYIVLNEIEAKEISGMKDVEHCLEYFKDKFPNLKVILTLGSKGSVYVDSDNRIFQPAYKVATVDTTGAGDTFTGYFVAGISENKDYSEVLKLASAAAAISVTKNGAAPSIPTKKEVLNQINSLVANADDRKKRLIQNIIEKYIDDNLNCANINDLAKEMSYSSVYTGKLVKSVTGKSFSKYLQQKRCEFAARELLNTNYSIKEIIEKSGYNNETFFRKAFKEMYGVKPLEYRQKKEK